MIILTAVYFSFNIIDSDAFLLKFCNLTLFKYPLRKLIFILLRVSTITIRVYSYRCLFSFRYHWFCSISSILHYSLHVSAWQLSCSWSYFNHLLKYRCINAFFFYLICLYFLVSPFEHIFSWLNVAVFIHSVYWTTFFFSNQSLPLTISLPHPILFTYSLSVWSFGWRDFLIAINFLVQSNHRFNFLSCSAK